jgi:predicted O-methyltransferase YrrM
MSNWLGDWRGQARAWLTRAEILRAIDRAFSRESDTAEQVGSSQETPRNFDSLPSKSMTAFRGFRRPLFLYLGAVIGAAHAFTIGVTRSGGRRLLREISEYLFGKGFGNEPYLLPVTRLAEYRSPLPLRIHAFESVDGNVTLEELVVLIATVAQHKSEHLFEFGTFDGRSTLNLAANAGPKAEVWTLDLPQTHLADARFVIDSREAKYVLKSASGSRFANTPEAVKITQLYGDSATFDYDPYVGKMDFVFVDASHAYEYVMNDSRQALSLIGRRKGVVFWHDYSAWEGVTRALNELYERDPAFADLKWIEGTTLVILDLPGSP